METVAWLPLKFMEPRILTNETIILVCLVLKSWTVSVTEPAHAWIKMNYSFKDQTGLVGLFKLWGVPHRYDFSKCAWFEVFAVGWSVCRCQAWLTCPWSSYVCKSCVWLNPGDQHLEALILLNRWSLWGLGPQRHQTLTWNKIFFMHSCGWDASMKQEMKMTPCILHMGNFKK